MNYRRNQPAASDEHTRVSIRIRNQQLFLDPPILDLVGPLLTRTFIPAIAADGSIQGNSAFENLLSPARSRPNAGLAYLVAYRLTQLGYEPRIQFGVRPLPVPTLAHQLFWDNGDRHLLDFVRGNSHGLIHLAPGVSRIRLLAQMFLAWPNQGFVVATGSHAEARQVRSQLLKQFRIKSSLVTPNWCPEHPRRMVVTTYTSLAHGQIECSQREFFVAYNARSALGELAHPCLIQVDSQFRLFGFLSTLETLTRWEQDWLHATFGFERLVIPRHHFEAIPPRVLWIPFRSQLVACDGVQPVSLKKQWVWNHAHRNRWIARLAKMLAGDREKLRQEYPDISEFLATRSITRILILTENDVHAAKLANRLQNWRHLHHPANGSFDLSRPMASTPPGSSPPEKAILTCQAASEYRLLWQPGLTVIVWAGAGPCLPTLPEDWLEVPVGSSRDLLLIDLWDESPPDLRKWSQQRLLAYQQAEWLSPGLTPFTERIKSFLRSREMSRSER